MRKMFEKVLFIAIASILAALVILGVYHDHIEGAEVDAQEKAAYYSHIKSDGAN